MCIYCVYIYIYIYIVSAALYLLWTFVSLIVSAAASYFILCCFTVCRKGAAPRLSSGIHYAVCV